MGINDRIIRTLGWLNTLASGKGYAAQIAGESEKAREAAAVLHEIITLTGKVERDRDRLEARLRHLLESDFIASFDELNPKTGKYKRDIAEADKIMLGAKDPTDKDWIAFKVFMELTDAALRDFLARNGILGGMDPWLPDAHTGRYTTDPEKIAERQRLYPYRAADRAEARARKYEGFGEQHTNAEWARRLGLPRNTLWRYMGKGFTIEEVVKLRGIDYPKNNPEG